MYRLLLSVGEIFLDSNLPEYEQCFHNDALKLFTANITNIVKM